MEEGNVDTGREVRAGNSLRARIMRYSPFEFRTYRGIPRISRGGLFAVLFLCIAWSWYDNYFDNSFLMEKMAPKSMGDLRNFVRNERGVNPRRPEILVAGSSINGMGIETSLLEKGMGYAAAKVSVGSGTVWDCFRILRKYERECRNVKVILIDTRRALFMNRPEMINGQPMAGRFQFFRDFCEWEDKTVSYTETQITRAILPLRFSVRDYQLKKTAANGFENIWQSRPENWKNRKFPKYRKIEEAARKRRPPSKMIRSDNETKKMIVDFLKYCEDNGIHIVFNVPPAWYGHEDFPWLFDEHYDKDNEVVVLLEHIRALPHCSLIEIGTLEDIDPHCKGNYEKYYYDTRHMNRKGATIYTNWLVDRMKRDEKIETALKTPRQPKEFFVKKQAETAYRTFVGLFKPAKSLKSAPVTVASPPNDNPTR